MLRLSIVLSLSLVTVVACSSQGSTPGSDTPSTSAAAVRVTYGDVVGKWRLVYTDDLRKANEAQLAKRKLSDPKALEEVRKKAAAEVAASEVEFTANHRYVSRTDGRVILEDTFAVRDDDDERTLALTFAKRPGNYPIVLRDANTLALVNPKGGELVFSRAR